MKCRRLIIFSGLLLSAFFSLSLSSDTFALEDLVINSPFSSGDICSNSSSSLPNCGYHYIITSCSNLLVNYSDGYILSYIDYGGVAANIHIYPFFNSVLDFSNDPITSFKISSVRGFPSDYNCSIILTDNSPFSSESPSGNLDITENGQYDVTNYATATVNVPTPEPEVIPGDYHDDLQDIKQAIIICGAVVLVIYFFYCIYRMIIRGVKV